MKTLLIILVFIPSLLLADNEYCYDEEGLLIELPANQKLVIVPRWWDEDDIYVELHRAAPVTAVDATDEDCDEDALVISPSVGCPD